VFKPLDELGIIFIGLLILIISYFIILNPFLNLSQHLNNLTFSMMTDPVYIYLFIKDEILAIENGISFPPLPYLIEKFFLGIIGLDNIWVLLVIYKLMAFIVFIKGISILYSQNFYSFFFTTLLISLFFTLDISPFFDRYPRPSFSNIFLFTVIFISLISFEKGYVKEITSFFYGLSSVILSITDPWAISVVFPLIIVALFKTSFKNFIYYLVGALLTALTLFLYFTQSNEFSFHREFLGLKIIYNSLYFLIDYYYLVLFNYFYIILLLIFFIICLIINKKSYFYLLVLCIIFGPIPFLILGKTIQAYHLINAAQDLIFIFLLILICFLFSIYKNKFHYKKYLLSLFFGLLFVSNFIFSDFSWPKRFNNMNISNQIYENVFNFSKGLNPECKLISNDPNLNFYWSFMRNGDVFPTDGFIRTNSPSKAIKEVRQSIFLLNKINQINDEDIDFLIRFSTHNYFVSTRSTISPSFESFFEEDYYNYLKSLSSVRSFWPWNFKPPNSLINYLKKDSFDMKFDKKIGFHVIYIDSSKGKINFKYSDFCKKNI